MTPDGCVTRMSGAVKALREHFGESQQAFSNRLGISLRAIANYEKDQIPSTLALDRLSEFAREAERDDLLDIFSAAYRNRRTSVAMTTVESRPHRGRPRRSAIEELAARFHDLSIHDQELALLVIRNIHMLDKRDAARKGAPAPVQLTLTGGLSDSDVEAAAREFGRMVDAHVPSMAVSESEEN